MKIYDTDNKIVVAAKKAAMICEYAIHNPLHPCFEDRNYKYTESMDDERRWNDLRREVNGERMHQFIREFLDEFEALTEAERRRVYPLFRRKWAYLDDKWARKVRKNSKQRDWTTCTPCWQQGLAEDGHIYAVTDLGIDLKMF